MANLTITAVDVSAVEAGAVNHRDELITFAGADVLAPGTILARRSVANAVTPAAGANTGDGTVTLATVAAGQVVPIVGAYDLTVTTAVANGGILKLEDPNGALVASDLIMTVGAGASTVFEAAGLEFTVTDGATDFIVGDTFTLTVAADGKMLPFAIAGAGGLQIPKAVLGYELTATGAGDLTARPIVDGLVRKEKLIIDLDGDGSNVSNTVIDQLRDFGIAALDVGELNAADNS